MAGTRFWLSAGLAAGIVVMLSLTACSPSPAQPSHPTARSTVTPTTSVYRLRTMPAGTVSITAAHGSVSVVISAHGLLTGSSVIARLAGSTCATADAPTISELPAMKAQSDGTLAATATVAATQAAVATPIHVELRPAVPPASAVGSTAPVAGAACADFSRASLTAAHAQLRALFRGDGTVATVYSGAAHYLSVHAAATGLPAGTNHAIEIAAGSCASQGRVMYMLPNLTARPDGSTDLTDTVANVTTAPAATRLYLVVLAGSTADVAAGTTPNTSSAPVMCADLHS